MTDREIRDAICELLGGLPGLVYSPDAPLPPPGGPEVIVYRDQLGTRDRGVAVAVYGGLDGIPNTVAPRFVQIRHRTAQGDLDGLSELAAATFGALHNLSRHGGINHASRTSWALLGLDGSGRPERTDNYTITPEV